MVVPQYSLTTKADGVYLSKIVGKESTEIKVETGLKGQDGSVEIISGVSEGDVVKISGVN